MRKALAALAALLSANPASSCVNADRTSLGLGSNKNRGGTSTAEGLALPWRCNSTHIM